MFTLEIGLRCRCFWCWSAIKICLIIMSAITITCWRRGWHPKQIFGLTLRTLFFFGGEEYYVYWDRDINKEWKPDVGHFENVETYDHLRNGRRRGRADGEQSRSTSFSGFLTPSSILSRLFFSVWAPSASDWLEKKRWASQNGDCFVLQMSLYKSYFLQVLHCLPLPSGNFE